MDRLSQNKFSELKVPIIPFFHLNRVQSGKYVTKFVNKLIMKVLIICSDLKKIGRFSGYVII